jgi:hypothetical protein
MILAELAVRNRFNLPELNERGKNGESETVRIRSSFR